MAKGKNNNALFIGIAALVVVIAVVVGVMVSKGGNGGDNGGGTSSQSETGLKASDLAIIDVMVDYGDYDTMEELSKDIQNGNATGEVVKIDGVVAHPGSLYSIVEKKESGTGSIGTQFIIEGDVEYPKDGDHVVITGKVVEKEPLYFVIKTLPEFIEVQEDEE